MLWVHQVTPLLKNEIQSNHFFHLHLLCSSELMPGTIQLSVLELMGLPQPEPAISSLSLKVTLGKREYQSRGREDFSFPVMSLLGNLTVMLLDAEGNEMLRTELRTISVVEKGLWIDSFPLKGGGLIQMKLQFSLSQEEHIRIREMRENVLKRKRGKQVKTGAKSPLSEQGNNKGITYSVTRGSLRAQSEQEDQSGSSGTQSLQVSEEHPEHLLEKDAPQLIETNKEITLKAESPPDVIAQAQISSEESLGPQSEEDQNLSSVRKMVNAFESSQFQEHGSRGLRMKYSEDKVDREGSLERASSEESDIISKSEPPQTIAKSSSSGMLSDMHQQRSLKLLQSAFLRKEEAEHLVPDSQHEAKGTGKAKLSFKKDQKLKGMSSGEDRADKEPTGSKKPAESVKLTGLVSESTMSSKRNFGTAKEKLNLGAFPKGSNTLYEDIAVGKSGAMPEPSSQNEEDLEAERKLTPTKICPNGDGTEDGNVTSKQNTSDHLQLSHEVKLDGTCTEKNTIEICSLSKDTQSCSQTTYQQQGSALQTVTGEVECSRSLSSEAAELLTYADIEGYPSGNLGIWGPRHLCITTGSRQLRDLAECCHNRRRSPPMENENVSTGTNDDKKQHCDASVQENENERITSCTSGKSEHEKSTSVSKSNSYAGLIEQGVRIAVVIVACGTLLLNTRQRKPGKTIPERKRR